jgi:hypothetical protein
MARAAMDNIHAPVTANGENMAATNQAKNRVADDGLHYSTKSAGSMFSKPGQGSYSTASMSCFRCGNHKPLEELTTKKILGRNAKVCAVDCRKKG